MFQKKFSFFAALVSLSFSSMACGNSPLFNHENAITSGSEAPRRNSPIAPQTECPINLKKSALCASFTWSAEPSAENENSATLRFWDLATGSATGPYRDADGEVAVKLWMPSMGHGSSPVTITANGNGIYSASRVFFVMPGEWEIRVQLKKDGQVVDQSSFMITL